MHQRGGYTFLVASQFEAQYAEVPKFNFLYVAQGHYSVQHDHLQVCFICIICLFWYVCFVCFVLFVLLLFWFVCFGMFEMFVFVFQRYLVCLFCFGICYFTFFLFATFFFCILYNRNQPIGSWPLSSATTSTFPIPLWSWWPTMAFTSAPI